MGKISVIFKKNKNENYIYLKKRIDTLLLDNLVFSLINPELQEREVLIFLA